MAQKSAVVCYTEVSEGKASDQAVISKKATGNDWNGSKGHLMQDLVGYGKLFRHCV